MMDIGFAEMFFVITYVASLEDKIQRHALCVRLLGEISDGHIGSFSDFEFCKDEVGYAHLLIQAREEVHQWARINTKLV